VKRTASEIGFYINDEDGLNKFDSSINCNIISGEEEESYYLDEVSKSTIKNVHLKVIYCSKTISYSM